MDGQADRGQTAEAREDATVAGRATVGTVSKGLPWGVIAVVMVSLLQGLTLGAIGAILMVAHDSGELTTSFDGTATGVLIIGVTLSSLGLLGVVLAFLLARRSQFARSALAAVATVETAAAVYSLIAVRDIRVGSIWSFAFSAGLIWLLYGSARTEEYFRR